MPRWKIRGIEIRHLRKDNMAVHKAMVDRIQDGKARAVLCTSISLAQVVSNRADRTHRNKGDIRMSQCMMPTRAEFPAITIRMCLWWTNTVAPCKETLRMAKSRTMVLILPTNNSMDILKDSSLLVKCLLVT